MSIRSFFLALALGGSLSGFGQVDSTAIIERKAEFRVLFNFDFRQTHVNSDPVRFYGFRIGAQKGRDIIAIGFYGLGDPYVQPMVDLGGLGVHDLVSEFDFTTVTYERLLVDSKRWQVGVPVSVGLGNYRKSYRDPEGRWIPYSTNELVPLELSCHADYNVFWWVFLGVGGGYRHVLAAERETTTELSNWTYYSKIGIRIGEIVKRVGQPKKKGHGS